MKLVKASWEKPSSMAQIPRRMENLYKTHGDDNFSPSTLFPTCSLWTPHKIDPEIDGIQLLPTRKVEHWTYWGGITIHWHLLLSELLIIWLPWVPTSIICGTKFYHSSILCLMTFYQRENLATRRPWFLLNKSGSQRVTSLMPHLSKSTHP